MMGEQFDAVRRWIRQLEDGSKSHKGYGYVIDWREINHRQVGRNRVPVQVVVADETEALNLIGKAADKRLFEQLAAITLQMFPALAGWLQRRPMTIWLDDRQIIYCGGIDTHGFAILDRLRSFLPQARSMLMDLATLEAHRLLWDSEETHKRYTGSLS